MRHDWRDRSGSAALPFVVLTRTSPSRHASLLGAFCTLVVVALLYAPDHFLVDVNAYNATYPLTPPALMSDGSFEYVIATVTDMDTASRDAERGEWFSHLTVFKLTRAPGGVSYSIDLDNATRLRLKSRLNEKGRGMELSELVVFNGRLLSFDDRSGIVYEIDPATGRTVPRHILPDGNGDEEKGFKCEWATVKDGMLYVGGLGKEWTTDGGVVEHRNPQWVKTLTHAGTVAHVNWAPVYLALREATGYSYPGYLLHESCTWSAVHRRWFFMPRRASTEAYSEAGDELRGTNLLLSCDESFGDIRETRVGPVEPKRGFSSFKFVPLTEDTEIVALKTEEHLGKTSTYLMVFRIDGTVLLEPTFVAEDKMEGIEFV